MLDRTATFLSLGLLIASGCGPTAPVSNLQGAAPHGGVNFRFLDQTGFVEIGAEPVDPSTPGSTKLNSHQIFVYFTEPDGLKPLASPPSDVKIVQGDLPPIPLTPKDATGKLGRFISAPGPYTEELRGVLEATIGGKKIEVPFTKR